MVAVVTEEPRLVMRWNGAIICDLPAHIPELQRRGEAHGQCACRHASVAPAQCRRARGEDKTGPR